MKSIIVAIILLFWNSFCLADEFSGPNHQTIRNCPWGTIFYEPISMGPHKYESKLDDIRIQLDTGEVRILGNGVNGYNLSCGKDLLTIKSTFSGFEIQWQKNKWTVSSQNGRYTLVSTSPQDIIQFERNANSFTIKGNKGFVTMTAYMGELTIKSSMGNAFIKNYMGSRTISGMPLGQVPYFGRGIYISFHGVGILIDTVKLFPMSEAFEWIEFKPLIGLPFDPNAR